MVRRLRPQGARGLVTLEAVCHTPVSNSDKLCWMESATFFLSGSHSVHRRVQVRMHIQCLRLKVSLETPFHVESQSGQDLGHHD